MKTRVTVSAVIKNQKGEILLCKMPVNRGAYPGQWAIPGGGIIEGEEMRQALKRELREEVGLEVVEIKPLCFDDATREKILADGQREKIYMILLVFEATAVEPAEVRINNEFDEYRWTPLTKVFEFDLNEATVKTLKTMGVK